MLPHTAQLTGILAISKNKMENQRKCFTEENKEIDAVSFCPE